MSILSNIKKRGLKDILNPAKWVIYIKYLFHKQAGVKIPEDEIISYAEQVIYRSTHPGCQQCVRAGECVHCGCKIPELFFEKDMECSGGHWSAMRSPEDWENYKEMLQMTIEPKYKL